MNKYICECCGKEFNGYDHVGLPRRFCSLECRDVVLVGEDSSAWKGGRGITPDGYVRVYIKNHWISKFYRDDNIREHILVVAEHLGEEVFSELKNNGFIIHHIDGNKLNNDIENLYVCDRSTHRKLDHQLIEIGYNLYRNKHIVFTDGIYCCPLLSDEEDVTG